MSKITMAELTAKMREYVKMEDELEFAAFSAYYQEVMTLLQADYQELDTDALIEAQGICGIMGTNAAARAAKKDENRKKFLKMQEKSEFWEKAIKARLKKEGLTEDEVKEKTEGLWA